MDAGFPQTWSIKKEENNMIKIHIMITDGNKTYEPRKFYNPEKAYEYIQDIYSLAIAEKVDIELKENQAEDDALDDVLKGSELEADGLVTITK